MRILLFQSTSHFGGTEMMNWRSWRELVARGHFVDACFLDDEGGVAALYHADDYEPTHFNSKQRSRITVWRAIKEYLKAGDYDFVYIFGLRSNLYGRLIARLFTNAIIITGQRSIDSWRRPWHFWLDRMTRAPVSRFVANSEVVATWLQDRCGVSAESISVIHSGLDAAPYDHVPVGLRRKEAQVSAETIVITAVGSLRSAKAHHVLLSAFAQLSISADCVLWLVGDGALRSKLEAMAAELGITQRVRFWGRRDDVPTLLRDSDIKVLSSEWEGLPGALMEAMACRVPVVATAVGGVPELVVDDVTGCLVDSGDDRQLANALQTLIDNPSMRQKMGEAGYARICTHFQLEASVDKLEALLTTLHQLREAA